MEKRNPGEMGPREKRCTRRAGRLGHAAGGVVLLATGVFLAQAALHSAPNEACGPGGALSVLAVRPFGPYLLGPVTRYRRIETSWGGTRLPAFGLLALGPG